MLVAAPAGPSAVAAGLLLHAGPAHDILGVTSSDTERGLLALLTAPPRLKTAGAAKISSSSVVAPSLVAPTTAAAAAPLAAAPPYRPMVAAIAACCFFWRLCSARCWCFFLFSSADVFCSCSCVSRSCCWSPVGVLERLAWYSCGSLEPANNAMHEKCEQRLSSVHSSAHKAGRSIKQGDKPVTMNTTCQVTHPASLLARSTRRSAQASASSEHVCKAPAPGCLQTCRAPLTHCLAQHPSRTQPW